MFPLRFAGLPIGRSVEVVRLRVRAVNRCMAPGGPTSAVAQETAMIHVADVNSSSSTGTLYLRVATEAQV